MHTNKKPPPQKNDSTCDAQFFFLLTRRSGRSLCMWARKRRNPTARYSRRFSLITRTPAQLALFLNLFFASVTHIRKHVFAWLSGALGPAVGLAPKGGGRTRCGRSCADALARCREREKRCNSHPRSSYYRRAENLVVFCASARRTAKTTAKTT